MLVKILSYHQVMPAYLDFISVFGWQSEPRGLRFSGFKDQTFAMNPLRYSPATSLGRSGRQFQMCYNLRSVSCLSDPNTNLSDMQWSIRQAAFYHHFDVGFGTTLWIVAKGDLEMKTRIQELTGRDGRPEDRSFATPEDSFRSSLAVHMLHSHWAMEGWLWYIQWLEDMMDEEASKSTIFLALNRANDSVVGTSPDSRQQPSPRGPRNTNAGRSRKGTVLGE
jgi:hypothetical protein